MSTGDRIAAALPNFPKEVIDQWLLPFANRIGWPPFPQHSLDLNNSWKYILCRKNLDYWCRIVWSKKKYDLKMDMFTSKSRGAIIGAATGMPPYHNLENSEERRKNLLQYLHDNKIFPLPPVCTVSSDGLLTVVDGNHRVGMYFLYLEYLKKNNVSLELPEQELWVGIEKK